MSGLSARGFGEVDFNPYLLEASITYPGAQRVGWHWI
jgi:hypothetical protein